MTTQLPESDRRFLTKHAAELATLTRRAQHPSGAFGWLDERSELDESRAPGLWIHCRMTHVAALETVRGGSGLEHMLTFGLEGLRSTFRDAECGGWVAALDDSSKPAYGHAFVALASASLVKAGVEGSRELLDEALAVIDETFWNDADGMVVDMWNREFTELDDYRGVNANMHTVEAFLAVADVTGERLYLERALRIVERVVHQVAREHDWRLPEHFDAQWRADLDFNKHNPADPFKPYGVTIGHLFEWARLTVNLRTALGDAAPEWMLDDAIALFDAAVTRGWHADGAPGYVYTTDFTDRPIVAERMHWVTCEAIAAAWALADVTGEQRFVDEWERAWDFAKRYHLDDVPGWIHELNSRTEYSGLVWPGRPDLYHAYQASLVPLLPGMVSFAGVMSPAAR